MQSWTCGVKRIITLILSIQFWMLALGSKYNHLFNCFKPFSISLLAGAPWVLRLHFSPYIKFQIIFFLFLGLGLGSGIVYLMRPSKIFIVLLLSSPLNWFFLSGQTRQGTRSSFMGAPRFFWGCIWFSEKIEIVSIATMINDICLHLKRLDGSIYYYLLYSIFLVAISPSVWRFRLILLSLSLSLVTHANQRIAKSLNRFFAFAISQRSAHKYSCSHSCNLWDLIEFNKYWNLQYCFTISYTYVRLSVVFVFFHFCHFATTIPFLKAFVA